MQGKSMTEGSSWKQIFNFTLPILFGSLLQQLYNTADTIIVGHFVSEDALSAVGTTSSFIFFVMAIAMGFSAGNGVLVAQYYGAKNEVEVRKSSSTGIIMLLFMGLIISVISFFIARPAYTYFVAVPNSILELTIRYFQIYSFGIIFQYGYNIFSYILRAIGDSAATLYFLLIASVLNIFLDLFFVIVLKMGVDGVAIATDISQAISFVCAYLYMVKKYPIFRFKLNEFVCDVKAAIQTLVIGFPIALQLMVVSCGLTFIQRAVNSFGKIMTASFTVGQRIEMYINLPCNAFQTTLATFTGQNIGAKKINRVKVGGMQTVAMSICITVFISILIWIFAPNICSAFGLSKEAAVYCNEHLRVIAMINILLSSYLPLFGLFQGANHPLIPTFVVTGALILRVVVTYIFKGSSIFGYSIIWWNGIFGFSVGFIITWTYYLSNLWQKNSLIEK